MPDEADDAARTLDAMARDMRDAQVVSVSGEEARVPDVVDVFTDEQAITVTLEARDVEASSLRVSLLDGHLLIHLGEGARALKRDVVLPVAVDEDAAVATFRNGVLDVVLPRRR